MSGENALNPAYAWKDSNRYPIYRTWDDEILAAKAHGLRVLNPDEMTEPFKRYWTACPDGFRQWGGPIGRPARDYSYPIYRTSTKEAQG